MSNTTDTHNGTGFSANSGSLPPAPGANGTHAPGSVLGPALDMTDAPTPEEIGMEAERAYNKDCLEQYLQELQREEADLKVKIIETPRSLKKRFRPWIWLKIAGCSSAVAFLSVAMTGNAARFAVDKTQSWIFAVLFAAVFPAIAIGLESYASAFSKRHIVRVMALLFGCSVAAFIAFFAGEFAYVPGYDDTGSGPGAMDYRALVITQAVVEITITFGLFSKVNAWCSELLKPVINPEWTWLCEKYEACTAAIAQKQMEIGEIIRASAIFQDQQARSAAFDHKWQRFLKS